MTAHTILIAHRHTHTYVCICIYIFICMYLYIYTYITFNLHALFRVHHASCLYLRNSSSMSRFSPRLGVLSCGLAFIHSLCNTLWTWSRSLSQTVYALTPSMVRRTAGIQTTQLRSATLE